LNILSINIIHGQVHWLGFLAQTVNVDIRIRLSQKATRIEGICSGIACGVGLGKLWLRTCLSCGLYCRRSGSFGRLSGWSWPWGVTSSNMSWILTVVRVMHLLNLWSKDFRSESVKLILILMCIILNAIPIGIDDISVNLSKAAHFGFLIL